MLNKIKIIGFNQNYLNQILFFLPGMQVAIPVRKKALYKTSFILYYLFHRHYRLMLNLYTSCNCICKCVYVDRNTILLNSCKSLGCLKKIIRIRFAFSFRIYILAYIPYSVHSKSKYVKISTYIRLPPKKYQKQSNRKIIFLFL